jgi:hypothetical protein
MRSTQLGDRVVAVLVEDAGVELVGALGANLAAAAGCSRHFTGEFVQEEPTQGLRGS